MSSEDYSKPPCWSSALQEYKADVKRMAVNSSLGTGRVLKDSSFYNCPCYSDDEPEVIVSVKDIHSSLRGAFSVIVTITGITFVDDYEAEDNGTKEFTAYMVDIEDKDTENEIKMIFYEDQCRFPYNMLQVGLRYHVYNFKIQAGPRCKLLATYRTRISRCFLPTVEPERILYNVKSGDMLEDDDSRTSCNCFDYIGILADDDDTPRRQWVLLDQSERRVPILFSDDLDLSSEIHADFKNPEAVCIVLLTKLRFGRYDGTTVLRFGTKSCLIRDPSQMLPEKVDSLRRWYMDLVKACDGPENVQDKIRGIPFIN